MRFEQVIFLNRFLENIKHGLKILHAFNESYLVKKKDEKAIASIARHLSTFKVFPLEGSGKKEPLASLDDPRLFPRKLALPSFLASGLKGTNDMRYLDQDIDALIERINIEFPHKTKLENIKLDVLLKMPKLWTPTLKEKDDHLAFINYITVIARVRYYRENDPVQWNRLLGQLQLKVEGSNDFKPLNLLVPVFIRNNFKAWWNRLTGSFAQQEDFTFGHHDEAFYGKVTSTQIDGMMEGNESACQVFDNNYFMTLMISYLKSKESTWQGEDVIKHFAKNLYNVLQENERGKKPDRTVQRDHVSTLLDLLVSRTRDHNPALFQKYYLNARTNFFRYILDTNEYIDQDNDFIISIRHLMKNAVLSEPFNDELIDAFISSKFKQVNDLFTIERVAEKFKNVQINKSTLVEMSAFLEEFNAYLTSLGLQDGLALLKGHAPGGGKPAAGQLSGFEALKRDMQVVLKVSDDDARNSPFSFQQVFSKKGQKDPRLSGIEEIHEFVPGFIYWETLLSKFGLQEKQVEPFKAFFEITPLAVDDLLHYLRQTSGNAARKNQEQLFVLAKFLIERFFEAWSSSSLDVAMFPVLKLSESGMVQKQFLSWNGLIDNNVFCTCNQEVIEELGSKLQKKGKPVYLLFDKQHTDEFEKWYGLVNTILETMKGAKIFYLETIQSKIANINDAITQSSRDQLVTLERKNPFFNETIFIRYLLPILQKCSFPHTFKDINILDVDAAFLNNSFVFDYLSETDADMTVEKFDGVVIDIKKEKITTFFEPQVHPHKQAVIIYVSKTFKKSDQKNEYYKFLFRRLFPKQKMEKGAYSQFLEFFNWMDDFDRTFFEDTADPGAIEAGILDYVYQRNTLQLKASKSYEIGKELRAFCDACQETWLELRPSWSASTGARELPAGTVDAWTRWFDLIASHLALDEVGKTKKVELRLDGDGKHVSVEIRYSLGSKDAPFPKTATGKQDYIKAMITAITQHFLDPGNGMRGSIESVFPGAGLLDVKGIAKVFKVLGSRPVREPPVTGPVPARPSSPDLEMPAVASSRPPGPAFPSPITGQNNRNNPSKQRIQVA